MWEESLGTQAGVHLIEGVRLMWGPLNTGFTVLSSAHEVSNGFYCFGYCLVKQRTVCIIIVWSCTDILPETPSLASLVYFFLFL